MSDLAIDLSLWHHLWCLLPHELLLHLLRLYRLLLVKKYLLLPVLIVGELHRHQELLLWLLDIVYLLLLVRLSKDVCVLATNLLGGLQNRLRLNLLPCEEALSYQRWQ